MRKIYLLLIISFCSSLVSFSQTGPAGVGNFDGSSGQKENIIWLDASTLGLANGAPILTWTDLSGNGNDLVQQGADNTPLFETNGLFGNNHSVARFDGTERYLRLLDNADLDNSLGGVTVIGVIFNPILDNAPRGIYSKRTTSGSQQSYSAFTWTTQRLNFDVHNGANRRLASSIALNTTTDYVFSNRYSGTVQETFLQSAASGSTVTSGSVTNTTSDLILGALNNNYGTYYNGDIAELIFYREALNDGERLIVENYLSQKYGITIANDFFGTDAGFDAAFVNDLMGIGTGDGITKLSSSGLSDALQIAEVNGALNSANEFIMLAHDNTAHADGVTSNLTVDPGILDSRWARSWFLEVTGDASAELRFDFGTAGLAFSGAASDYVLLYRANTTDDYTKILASSYAVENGDQLVVNLGNLNMPSGYYTVGEGTQLVAGSWYSYQSGDWNDPLTWTTISNGTLREPIIGGVPTSGDNVTILSGRTVRMDTDDNDGVTLTVNGRLNIENTSGHNFFSISGNGTISLEGDVGLLDNFPSGNASLFADAVVGGTVEILGAGLSLDNNRTFNNMLVSLDNSTDVAILLANYTINGDLTISNGILRINDNIATTNLSLTANGNVQIDATGELNVGTADARHEFNFHGDFTNQGRAEFTNRVVPNYGTEATDGIVDANFLSGTSNQTIDCNGVTNFYRIEIDKGVDQTYILDINASLASNFNLYGPADFGHGSVAQLTTNDNGLGLLRGTVRLNTNVDVPVLNNTGNYNISESARLWVNGGSAEKPAGTAIVPYGTIQLSSGTLDAPINSGITTRDNGNIVIEGGTMTVNQIRTSVLGVENIGGYTQSGGTVNVTGNSISTSYYAFSLTYPGNTFNMSGGTLRVSGAPNGATTGGIFIASNESNQNITGGTVIMEMTRNNRYKLTSLSPFWNVILRYTSGTSSEIDLIDGTSGTGGGATTIPSVDLRVLNDLTIENGIRLDHNGYNVEIGSDFMIETTGAYRYAASLNNTTTINGSDNSLLSFMNRSGGVGDEQRFWNLVIDKPHGKVVSLASAKPDLTGNNNNLVRIEGDFFKVLSGTMDQGFHSIRMYADTLVNYDELMVYDTTNPTDDAVANGNNDIFKLRDDGGAATVFITADSSRFGAIKLNSQNEIITLNSDVKIDYLDYRHGRFNTQDHNLTIDFIDDNVNNNAQFDINGNGTFQGFERGIFSPADMIITDGNASNGGLSLLITADGTYTFPLGIGTDATELLRNNSKYTPATVTVSGFSDDGYITIRPADDVLATTDPTGGDILSYYWRVDYEGFTVLPTVEYQFTYYDEDLDGSVNEATFVPGKVLDLVPFTRSSEIAANLDDVNNLITFDAGGGGGFTLEPASYTTGQAPRFVGAPEIYYSRQDGNWNVVATWSTISHTSATNTGTFPEVGDVAIISFDGVNDYHRINVVGSVEVAILEFNSYANATAKNIRLSRLTFGANENLNAAIVRGIGELHFQSNNGVGPGIIDVDTDLGSFVDDKRSSFIYNLAGVGDITIPAIAKYPSLRFYAAAANGSITKTERFFLDKDIECSNLLLDGNSVLEVTNDILITDTLFIGANRDGELIFNNGTTPNVVEANHLIFGSDLFGANRAENVNRIFVESGGANGVEHRLIINNDILITTGSGGVFSDAGAGFDLYTNASDNNVILELAGIGVNTMQIEGDDDIGANGIQFIPEFYRIVANKGTDITSTFEFADGFTLLGPTSGATKALELQNGLLILNTDDSDININLTTGGDDFSIPSGTGIQVTAAQVNVSGDDSGIALDGSLIIDGGTVNMDDAVGNGNNYIEYSASGNAILEMSSGTLNVGSQIRPITSASTGILKYRQTGGDVRIGTQAGPESTRGMLQIYNVGSEFTYTGGTLTIERHQTTPSIAALFLDPDISDVTGSTITIFNANTPAGQTDFRINSTIALDNLTINGTNSPTATLNINTLTVNDQLSIATNATFLGDALTLTVGGDFVNDGTYDAEGNETIFNSGTSQSISGSGTNTFFQFTKEEVGILSLTNSIDVADLFTITQGTVDDGGFSINLASDAVIDGTHLSVGGLGLVFAGAANQELRRSGAGTGTVGMISINNANGVTVPDGNGYDFDVEGGLRLENGLFNVGGASILFGLNADITPVSPFSVTNMIQTNSSFVDSGIGKQFAANFNTDFVFPVGQTFYTPVSFDFGSPGNTFGTTAGTLTIRPSDEYHPTINDGTDVLASGDINNVLQYYWTIEASGVTGLVSDMTLVYDQSDVLSDEPGPTYDEDDYFSARILAFSNPTNDINKFDPTTVDEITNTITFNFSGATTNGITGDYFAGLDEAIPNNVATYTAIGGGGDVDQEIYDIPLPSGAGVPPSGAVVIIPSGQVVRLNVDNIRLYRTEIQAGGVLEVDNTTNHRLGTLEGTGTLRIVSDGINANLPAFSGTFLSCTGGGLEYAGTGSYSILSGISTLRNLTLSGTGDRNFPNNNITICEDWVVDGPTVSFQTNRRITVTGSATLQSGVINGPTGGSSRFNIFGNNFTLNGGVFNAGSFGSANILQNLVISGGIFNMGSSFYPFRVGSDITFTSGTFNGGAGIARIELTTFPSDGLVENTVINGNFTGANAFRNLTINKNGSGRNVSLSSSIEVTTSLTLTDGNIISNSNNVHIGATASVSPPAGSTNSHVTGSVTKEMTSAGSSFTFPIGSTSLWRPATVNSVSDGGLTWSAEYFEADPTTEPLVDNLTPTNPGAIATVRNGEYWKISDDTGAVPPPGVTATVGLSWGVESLVSAISSEREELEVMIWNDGITSWDNLGGTTFSGGHLQSGGNFIAVTANSFSEQIFTLGSGDFANPLPITLKSFEGYAENGNHYIEWVTTSEINNDYFELERSADGKNFEVITTVNGAGTTSVEQGYSYIDTTPFFGKNYYRLRQIDIDGQSKYADNIVLIENDSDFEKLSYKLYPNPTDRSNINLEINSPDSDRDIRISLYDMYGRRYYSQTISANELYKPLSIGMSSEAKSGMYIVIVEQGELKVQKKLLVQ